MNAQGGVPRRLTWEPTGSYAAGWTPDGKDVLFASMHASYSDFFRLFVTHADGTGTPTVLPLPSAVTGNYSPDGTTLAYEPILQWEDAWKHYRGGQTKKVWLVNMKTLDLVKVPRDNSNDFNPVWAGKSVYFLLGPQRSVSLFRYDTESKAVTQVVDNHGYDLKTVAAGPGALVYEQFGSLHLYDLGTQKEHPVEITIHGDLPELTPHLTNISADQVQNIGVSPTGVRVVAEAHGDIFTLPAEKGDTRNLTKTPGVAERDPSWSPDGKVDRVLQRCIRRVSTLHSRSGWPTPTQGDRPWPEPLVLLQSALVPGFQAHRVLRQAPAPLVCRRRRRQAHPRRHRPARKFWFIHRAKLVTRLTMDCLHARS